MTISQHTRKLLWGRSGSRCAICKRELIIESTTDDNESIVGDECHIVSAATNGPRYNKKFPVEKENDFSNLILLCKVDHKMVDDQVNEYSASKLIKIKKDHEKWVSKQLDLKNAKLGRGRIGQIPGEQLDFLFRIRSGKDLLDIVLGACVFASNYDELYDDKDFELVAEFLQNALNWGELGEFDTLREKMEVARTFDKEIRKLENAGFLVFGGREKQILGGGEEPDIDWPVAHVRVLHKSNPDIIFLDDNIEQVDDNLVGSK